MFKTIDETLNFIESQRINNTSLDDFKKVFEKYDNFQDNLKYVHVTGTNGKGSTSKLLNDVLILNKLNVGLFTSPHMIIANDRIRVNNKYISDEDLIRLCSYFYDDILKFKLNFFQIYTLISLRYFYEQDCDLVIMEVGIGGLLDSTNVINSLLSIITNISFDHTEKLGKTIKEIAVQKAGIIKNNQEVITMVQQDEALEIIRDKTKVMNAKLHELVPVESKVQDGKRMFNFENQSYTLYSSAKYQVHNTQIVIKALKLLEELLNISIKQETLTEAFINFEWIGRFETVSKDPLIILDGAHNVSGIKTLCDEKMENTVVIFSALKDKDYPQMIDLLRDNFDEVIFCEFDFYRALKKEDLKQLDIKVVQSLEDGLEYYKKEKPNHTILICGSLYFISEVRKVYKGE